MNLLGAILYDPTTAVNKATSSLLAMTAIDTTNLRLTVTVPAHGYLFVRMAGAVNGGTTWPDLLFGVLQGSTVRGRAQAIPHIDRGTAVAAADGVFVAEFACSLAAGSTVLDAAYAVQNISASSNLHYGGPDNNSGNNAWGGFVFEIWDPQPLPTAAPGAANGVLIAGSNAATTVNITGNLTGNVTGAVGSVTGAVGSVTAAVTVGTINPDVVNASALAGDAVAEVQSGLATSANQGTIIAGLIAINSDTDDIQTRLPAALVGGRMDSSTGAMAANVVTASAIAADAIGASELAADAAAEIAAAVAAVVVSGTMTLAEVLKVLGAVAAGKTTITPGAPGASTVVFRDLQDTKDSITATMADSARTAVTVVP